MMRWRTTLRGSPRPLMGCRPWLQSWKLYIATYHLLPTCQHQLALAPASTKFLRWLYKNVRSALQSWLRGVPLHEHVVPFMRAKHLSRLDASLDPVIATMLGCAVSASTGRAMQTRRTNQNGRKMALSCDLKATLAEMLHLTVDGRGLVHSSQVPECHR